MVIILGLVFFVRFPGIQLNSPQTAVSPAADPTGLEINTSSEDLLGHLPYSEAPTNELVAVSGDGQIKLRTAAADAYNRMAAAALADGIALVPLSGFRTIADQEYLFFRVKEQRAQVATQRAEVSAPPGHSEHHTGYAIDIGDPDQPDTHLSESFAQTPAFQWLTAHAARFSFELSFPPENPQGISYEPWHWRFVELTRTV